MIHQVYVGLGGNLGDPRSFLSQALTQIQTHPAIFDFRASHFYRTTPVELLDTNPNDFINAVCTFKTRLNPKELMAALEHIERTLGKVPKNKNESRIIDLDLLFFDKKCYKDEQLTIPHPKWIERLFVLIPLAELASEIIIRLDSGEEVRYDLSSLLQKFENRHHENVVRIEGEQYDSKNCKN